MLRSFISLFTGGLVGKLLGVAREVLFAALYGTSSVAAAYRVAQAGTLIPVHFFTSDGLNAGFLPMHARYLRSHPHRADVLFRVIQTLLILVSGLLLLVLAIARNQWVALIAPGLDASTGELASRMLAITALGIPFYISFSMLAYLEMSHGSYRLAAARPGVQSIGLIIGTATAFWLQRPSLLAWGFTVPYIVMCVWALRRTRHLRSGEPVLRISRDESRRVLAEFWATVRPLLILPFLLQGCIAAERAVASLMGTDVIAALDYARIITDTGLVLLAAPLGLAGLSTMSQGAGDLVKRRLERIVPTLLITTLPISTVLFVNSHGVIALVFERGHFGDHAVDVCAQILRGLSIGFWAQVISYFLVKVLSAQLRNKEAMRMMATTLLINIAINFLLYRLLGPTVLGLGASVAAVALLALSLRALQIQGPTYQTILLLTPGAILASVCGLSVRAEGMVGLTGSIAAMTAAWVAYLALIPELRRVTLTVVREVRQTRT